MRMRPLVERHTYTRMCATALAVERKNNGENMIRLVLLLAVFLILLQLATTRVTPATEAPARPSGR